MYDKENDSLHFCFSYEPDYGQFVERVDQMERVRENDGAPPGPWMLQQLLLSAQEEISEFNLLPEPPTKSMFAASSSELNHAIENDNFEKCPNCNDHMEDHILCEFCAKFVCAKCCFRKRVIPFSPNYFPRSQCQRCHKKFRKLLAHQNFYKQKQLLMRINTHFQKKYEENLEKKKKMDEKMQNQRRKIMEENIQENRLKSEIKLMKKQIEYKSLKLQFLKKEKLILKLQRQQEEKLRNREINESIKKSEIIRAQLVEDEKKKNINFKGSDEQENLLPLFNGLFEENISTEEKRKNHVEGRVEEFFLKQKAEESMQVVMKQDTNGSEEQDSTSDQIKNCEKEVYIEGQNSTFFQLFEATDTKKQFTSEQEEILLIKNCQQSKLKISQNYPEEFIHDKNKCECQVM